MPENAPGDFYVAAGLCTSCGLVHGEAPDLMNDPKLPYTECYFHRQPQTPEEVQRAIDALCVSEMSALRYGGGTPAIIAQLRQRRRGYLCDQTPEGQNFLIQIETEKKRLQEQKAQPISWWRRMFGGGR